VIDFLQKILPFVAVASAITSLVATFMAFLVTRRSRQILEKLMTKEALLEETLVIDDPEIEPVPEVQDNEAEDGQG